MSVPEGGNPYEHAPDLVIVNDLLRLKVQKMEEDDRDSRGLINDISRQRSELETMLKEAERRAEAAELQLRDIALKAQAVMECLGQHGPSIVPHLIDTDDNPGEYLRQAVRNVLTNVRSNCPWCGSGQHVGAHCPQKDGPSPSMPCSNEMPISAADVEKLKSLPGKGPQSPVPEDDSL